MNASLLTPDQAARFWRKAVVDRNGCWVWTAAHRTSGYGIFNVNGKIRTASRLAYEIVFGPVADPETYVCHHCDNPPCIRPDHLFLGSNSDNQRDASRKGRKPHGEQHPRARLSEQDVLVAFSARRAGIRQATIARFFGVDHETIGSIFRGQNWSHIDPSCAVRVPEEIVLFAQIDAANMHEIYIRTRARGEFNGRSRARRNEPERIASEERA